MFSTIEKTNNFFFPFFTRTPSFLLTKIVFNETRKPIEILIQNARKILF